MSRDSRGGRILTRLEAEPFLQGFYTLKGFAGDGGIFERDAVGFLDAHGELQRVDRVEPEAAGSEEQRLGLNFLGPDPEHAIIDQKLSDIIEGDLGHQFKEACHSLFVEGNSHYFWFFNSNKPN